MSDVEPFVHGEEGTHIVCQNRLDAEGGKSRCCTCVPHDNCNLNE